MNLPLGRRVALLVAAGLGFGLLSLLRWPPRAWPSGPWNPEQEGARVPALLAQLQDPVHWDRAYQFAWTQRDLVTALRWRMLIPVVAHDLGLSPVQYLWLPWIGIATLVVAAGRYAWRASHDVQRTACAMGLATTSFAWLGGTCGLGNMDSFYLTALLVCAFSPSDTAVLAACLFGPWIDERFLLALPLVAAVRARQGLRLWPLAAVLPYCAVRIAALWAGNTGDGSYLVLHAAMFRRFVVWLPVGWWHGWRVGWLVVAAGLWLGWRSAGGYARTLMAAGALGLLAIGFLAWDSSRSIAVLLPWAVYGASQSVLPRPALWAAVALNYLLPVAFVTATYSSTQGIVPTALLLP
jgi:hypothetical protein